jgi:hypothetical protein
MGKRSLDIRNQNHMAIICLKSSFESLGLWRTIEDSKTRRYPHGLAHLVVTQLFKVYRKISSTNLIEFLCAKHKLSLCDGETPKNYLITYVTWKQKRLLRHS